MAYRKGANHPYRQFTSVFLHLFPTNEPFIMDNLLLIRHFILHIHDWQVELYYSIIVFNSPRSSNKQSTNQPTNQPKRKNIIIKTTTGLTLHTQSHSLSNTYWYNGSSTSKSAIGVSSMLSSIISFNRDFGIPETNRIVSTTTFDADFVSAPCSACLFTYTRENKSVSFHRVPDRWRNSSRFRKGET